jgi:4-hydroxysphinganine ceramide fatty acyl 2-hydroxylase
MEDPNEHSHSDSAYDLLSDYCIGLIGNLETTCSETNEVDEHFSPEETALDADFERNQFLDLKRPLITQVLTSNFSKSFYLHQVHQPRYLPYPARFFGPTWMEMLTRTSWYVVPLVWLPITGFLIYKSLTQQAALGATGQVEIPSSAYALTLGCFLFGNFVWTILEYIFHRFLFHVDEYLPDHPYALTAHFLMHGVHHYLPWVAKPLVLECTDALWISTDATDFD